MLRNLASAQSRSRNRRRPSGDRLHNVSKTLEDSGALRSTDEHNVFGVSSGPRNPCRQKSRAICYLENASQRVRIPASPPLPRRFLSIFANPGFHQPPFATTVPDSSNRIASSIALFDLRCLYRCVVASSLCLACSWMARAGPRLVNEKPDRRLTPPAGNPVSNHPTEPWNSRTSSS
jgi:hypothetical protein